MNTKIYILLASIVVASAVGSYVTKLYWKDKYNTLVISQQEAVKKNLSYVIEIERLRRDKSSAIEQKLLAEEKARQTKATVVTEEVIKYVETNTTSSCTLDDDWVRIYNASKAVPGTP